MQRVADGKIRDNVNQGAGWLIVIGHEEYIDQRAKGYSTWKVGAYEPTTQRHGDIEYLYVVDLEDKTIEVYKTGFGSTNNDKRIDTLQF